MRVPISGRCLRVRSSPSATTRRPLLSSRVLPMAACTTTTRPVPAAPNHALQRTATGVQVACACFVLPRRWLSLSLSPLGPATFRLAMFKLIFLGLLLAAQASFANDLPKLPRTVRNPAAEFLPYVPPNARVLAIHYDFDGDGVEDVAYADSLECGHHGNCTYEIFLRRADNRYIEVGNIMFLPMWSAAEASGPCPPRTILCTTIPPPARFPPLTTRPHWQSPPTVWRSSPSSLANSRPA